jgi:transposase
VVSLQPQEWSLVPELTARVARAMAGRGRLPLAMRVRDELGELFADADFAEAFAPQGKPGWSPGRLAMVTALQFAEDLTDRAAADRLRYDVSWRYCLGMELEEPGFDASVLCEFRARLVEHGLEARALDLLLANLKEKELVTAGGKQRTDSTHVEAAIRNLNRLELAGEAVRAALEALSAAAPHWVAAVLEVPQWDRRYGRRIDESWRPPASQAKRDALALDYGRDAVELLQAVFHRQSPHWLRELPAVQVLRQITVQNYCISTDRQGREVVKRREAEKEGLPPGRRRLTSPYDTDARYGVKGDLWWTGYKLHLSESCQDRAEAGTDGTGESAGKQGRPPVPNLITHVATTDATVPDNVMTAPINQALVERELGPAEHYMDSGYAAADLIADAARDGIALITPLLGDTSRQARERSGYDRGAFTVDWHSKQVTCPQGRTSDHWNPCRQRDTQAVVVRFNLGTCRPCPVREQCTSSRLSGRQLTLRSRELHELAQANRAAQQDKSWQAKYALRSGVEGTIAQAVNVTGSRRARYRSLPKVHLEHVYSAVAINLIRLDAWWNDRPLDHGHTSQLTRLNYTLTA